MTTAERELDQNTNFDWNRIQESGQEVEPLFGPGYTGLVNLGNRYFWFPKVVLLQSCYFFFLVTVLFSVVIWQQLCKLSFRLVASIPGQYHTLAVL